MTVKLLTEHNLEFLSLKGGCRGSSESTLDKMPCCWKSHVVAQMLLTKTHQITCQIANSIDLDKAGSSLNYRSNLYAKIEQILHR